MSDPAKSSSAHSKLGASSMYRWAACPGSVALAATLPPAPTSSYADEGTRAHEIAARVLETGWWTDKDNPKADDVDDETRTAIIVYLDAVAAAFRPWCKRLIEHRFDLSKVYPGCFGTGDCIVYDPKTGTLYVFDYKHGQGIPVEVVGKDGKPNPQLMYYGLGALMTTDFKVNRVVLTVVQPRCNHPDGPVRSVTIPVMDMLDFAADLVTYAKATEAPNAPLNSGEHCRFCPAAGVCPKLGEVAQKVAKDDFMNQIEAADIAGAPIEGAYDPKRLAETLSQLTTLENYIKAVREFAYSEAQQGRCPPGWKLVDKRASRKWRMDDGEERLVSHLQNATMFKKEALYDKPSLLTPPALEKILGKRFFSELCEEFVVKESSGTKLVPEWEKGDPVTVLTAKDDFKVLPEPAPDPKSLFD
jgi:hypothetical protein